ncbi:MAG: helix-turn-helix domain-containing protein [Prevotellaceae bacterium]|nr:helix-turn-helix domain-containing protein [Prevotellaceae bacterium]
MNSSQFSTRIGLEDLSHYTEADYIDGDIIILDDLRELPIEGSFQTEMTFILICVEGRMQVDINGKTYKVNVHDMLVCPPNVFLDNYMISPNFNSKIIGLSYSALQRMLNVNKDIWNMMLHLVKNPVFHLDDYLLELMENYYTLLSFKLKHADDMYRKEVMHALFQAIFYDFCAILMPFMTNKNYTDSGNMKQGDLIVKKFIFLLSESQGKERSVSYFADKLCITPKYLSTVCKASSGKTALDWIHEYTIEVITQQLKYTDKTIKEICDDLNFPNLSFFGKFVKNHLGVSPKEYRKRFANTDAKGKEQS